MAEEEVEEKKKGAEPEGEGDEGEQPKGASKKKKLLLILVPVLLLALAAGGFVLFGGSGEGEDKTAVEQTEVKPQNFVFYDLPDILVNLASRGNTKNFLKISISLELDDPLDVEKIQRLEPRIIDKFQVYLRGLALEDLQGTQGVYRLREELLTRINATTEPVKISQVLFREILVQ